MKVFLMILLSAIAPIMGCRAQLNLGFNSYIQLYGECQEMIKKPGDLILCRFVKKEISITVFLLNSRGAAIAYERSEPFSEAEITNLVLKNCPLANKNNLSEIDNQTVLYQNNGDLKVISRIGSIISITGKEYIEYLNRQEKEKML